MSRERTPRGRGQDRDRVAGSQRYEVRYLAEELGVTEEEVKEAIQTVGHDRKKLTAWLRGGKNNRDSVDHP
jgi:hypothetical protein